MFRDDSAVAQPELQKRVPRLLCIDDHHPDAVRSNLLCYTENLIAHVSRHRNVCPTIGDDDHHRDHLAVLPPLLQENLHAFHQPGAKRRLPAGGEIFQLLLREIDT